MSAPTLKRRRRKADQSGLKRFQATSSFSIRNESGGSSYSHQPGTIYKTNVTVIYFVTVGIYCAIIFRSQSYLPLNQPINKSSKHNNNTQIQLRINKFIQEGFFDSNRKFDITCCLKVMNVFFGFDKDWTKANAFRPSTLH